PPPAILQFAPKISLRPRSHADALARKSPIAQRQPGRHVSLLPERANVDARDRWLPLDSFQALRHLEHARHALSFQGRAAGPLAMNCIVWRFKPELSQWTSIGSNLKSAILAGEFTTRVSPPATTATSVIDCPRKKSSARRP